MYENLNKILKISDYNKLLEELKMDAKQRSAIIYPKQLFGRSLYKENFSGILPFLDSTLRFFMIKNLGKGILTDESKNFISQSKFNK